MKKKRQLAYTRKNLLRKKKLPLKYPFKIRTKRPIVHRNSRCSITNDFSLAPSVAMVEVQVGNRESYLEDYIYK